MKCIFDIREKSFPKLSGFSILRFFGACEVSQILSSANLEENLKREGQSLLVYKYKNSERKFIAFQAYLCLKINFYLVLETVETQHTILSWDFFTSQFAIYGWVIL